MQKILKFKSLKYYAAEIEYSTNGWLEKNQIGDKFKRAEAEDATPSACCGESERWNKVGKEESFKRFQESAWSGIPDNGLVEIEQAFAADEGDKSQTRSWKFFLFFYIYIIIIINQSIFYKK